MKKLLVLFLVAVSVLGLAACGGPAKEFGYGMAYARVHGGHYVGVAEVVVDKDNKVVKVDFEEYYLPYNAAQVGTVGANPELVSHADVIVAGDDEVAATKLYAKYFKVKSLLFVGSFNATDNAVEYTANGIEINDWVDSEENAIAYVDAIENGEIFIATSAGVKHTELVVAGNAFYGFAKSATGYWAVSPTRLLGWGGNMRAMELALIGTDFSEEASRGETETYWSIGDAVTGATLTDFPDYYNLAKAAYDKAIA